ncbi:MAG: hypothetical protein WC371_00025, partial [Parachlamydiales bacterium]
MAKAHPAAGVVPHGSLDGSFSRPEVLTSADIQFQDLPFIQKVWHLTIFKTAVMARSLFEWRFRLPLLNYGGCLKLFSIQWLYDYVSPSVNWLSGTGCRNEGYDRVRAERAKAVFRSLGGESRKLKTADGIEIETMLFRSSRLKELIEKHGGRW